jgi:hypothetical protein
LRGVKWVESGRTSARSSVAAPSIDCSAGCIFAPAHRMLVGRIPSSQHPIMSSHPRSTGPWVPSQFSPYLRSRSAARILVLSMLIRRSLGDSGATILREDQPIYTTPVQTHYFNCPVRRNRP